MFSRIARSSKSQRLLTGTDRVDLALDLDDAVLAAKQVDGVIDLGVFDQDVLGVLVVFLTKDDRVRVFESLPKPGRYYSRRSTWYRRAWSRQDVSEST